MRVGKFSPSEVKAVVADLKHAEDEAKSYKRIALLAAAVSLGLLGVPSR